MRILGKEVMEVSHPDRPEDSSETPPPRIPLRPAENSGSLRPGEASGSLPPPLRIQPLSRPGAPPPPPVPGAPGPAQKIELQQLELKGQPRPVSPGVPIPPRPSVPRNPEEPPQDLSGVVPRGWPPPRVPLGEESEPTSELEPKPKAEQTPRFLPAPEVPASPLAARGRAADAQAHPRVPLGPPPELDDDLQRGGVASDAKASWAEGGETVPIHSGGNKSRKKPAMSKKGPIILVTAFAAVLLVLLAMPILQKKPALSASASPTAAADPDPLAPPGETPGVSSSPLPLVTPSPEPVVQETPRPSLVETPKPVVETPKPVVETPKPVVETPRPVVVETPKPVLKETPKPSPTVAIKPPPIRPEPPPAKDPVKSSFSVRVYLTPVGVDSKVYLVDQDDRNHRYSDEGAGNLHVQPKKKGSYTLKVVAPGYETFTKDIKVEGDHNLAVRLEKIPPPPPPPAYVPPAPGPAPYTPQYSPPPQYYPPPRPAPAPYQIPAPGI